MTGCYIMSIQFFLDLFRGRMPLCLLNHLKILCWSPHHPKFPQKYKLPYCVEDEILQLRKFYIYIFVCVWVDFSNKTLIHVKMFVCVCVCCWGGRGCELPQVRHVDAHVCICMCVYVCVGWGILQVKYALYNICVCVRVCTLVCIFK